MVKLLKKVLCLGLRNAGLVIGGLEVVESVLMCFLLGSIVSNSDMFAEQLRDSWIPENEDKKEIFRVAVVVFGRIYLVETVINGVLSVLLISGIRKVRLTSKILYLFNRVFTLIETQKRHSMILPWLILNAIDIFVSVVTLAVFFCGMCENIMGFWFFVLLKVLKLALYSYIHFAIYSLYIKIKMNEDTKHSEVEYTVADSH
ncbi:uncharacterized protein LOC132789751 [Drosophila nasuta]|uniref:uncharacterized protein LOC132789751 n=1 Tax=Drosophila nasuta TaxID=42062 RepID=UPI00295E6EED|nr:uncharacterized protein LOC132789751 [Drosophila nasuta]